MDGQVVEITTRELVHPAECVSHIIVDTLRKQFTWGRERGITRENGAGVVSQVGKLHEEAAEIAEAWAAGDIQKVTDGIGDCLVVLVQISRLAGVSLDDAAAQAWKDIRDRKGVLRHGIFVKQQDIDAMQEAGHSVDGYSSAQELLDALEELCKTSQES